MAGVEAYPDMVLSFHPVDNLPELLEGTSDLRTLAGHRLKENCGRLLRFHDLVQEVRNLADRGLRILIDPAARMKVVILIRDGLHADRVIRHTGIGKLADLWFWRAGIQRIRRVRNKGCKVMIA